MKRTLSEIQNENIAKVWKRVDARLERERQAKELEVKRKAVEKKNKRRKG